MGLFITLEGIDGCGKSTQIKKLYANLFNYGYRATLTREPGGTSISEKIREIILGTENSEMSDRCELLLYLASRAQHVEQKILPDILDGKIVLSDRFEEATFAYQSYGRGLDFNAVWFMNNFATKCITPDLTVIIDITLEESTKRLKESGKSKDRIEQCDIEFFNKVRDGYLKRAAEYPDRVFLVDGSSSIGEIEEQILQRVLKVIETKKINKASSC